MGLALCEALGRRLRLRLRLALDLTHVSPEAMADARMPTAVPSAVHVVLAEAKSVSGCASAAVSVPVWM